MNYFLGTAPMLTQVSQTAAIQTTQPRFSIGETLQNFLKDTLSGKVQWKHRQEKQANGLLDIFTALRNGVEVQIQGVRSPNGNEKIPDQLRDWVVLLTWKDKGKAKDAKDQRKALDGKTLLLPPSVPENTNAGENTIAKLFRAAYERVANLFSEFVPVLKHLAEQLREKSINFSYTFIKPDLKFGLPGGKMLQVGDKEPRLEMFRSGLGGPIQITLYNQSKRPIKLASQSLQNPELREALDQLIQEVNAQRTGQENKGLESF